ncbi:MAG: hypothetical protein WAV90_19210 [Gordonia amarae]
MATLLFPIVHGDHRSAAEIAVDLSPGSALGRTLTAHLPGGRWFGREVHLYRVDEGWVLVTPADGTHHWFEPGGGAQELIGEEDAFALIAGSGLKMG